MATQLPKLILTPVQDVPGKKEIVREIHLSSKVMVGRAVPNKKLPSKDNAIFENRVLSRSHAEIWHESENGNCLIYIRDTGSSNGTYLNMHRLSNNNEKSEPFPLKTGDQLRLGVDVVESTSTHKCVVLNVKIILPTSVTPIEEILTADPKLLESASREALMIQINQLRNAYLSTCKDLAAMEKELTQTQVTEQKLGERVCSLNNTLESLLSHLNDNIEEKVNHDRLIDRMAMLEQQLDFFRRRISDIASGDNSSIDSTEAATELTEGKYMDITNAKSAMIRAFDEKNKIRQEFLRIQTDWQQTVSDHEVEVRRLNSQHSELQKKFNEVVLILKVTRQFVAERVGWDILQEIEEANKHIFAPLLNIPNFDTSISTDDVMTTSEDVKSGSISCDDGSVPDVACSHQNKGIS
eukprot:gene605-3915_t